MDINKSVFFTKYTLITTLKVEKKQKICIIINKIAFEYLVVILFYNYH